MSIFEYYQNSLELFCTLIAAIKNGESSEVAVAIMQIEQKSKKEADVLLNHSYSEAMTVAIQKGNPEIFKQLCVFCAPRLKNFEFNESRSIIKNLETHNNAEIGQIFLWFLNNCPKTVQPLLTYAVYLHDNAYLLDRICNDTSNENLRFVLARRAMELNTINLVWRIVQTTPQVLPDVKDCNPNTIEGQSWIDMHERYRVWKAQQEHKRLTMEVVGVDKHKIARKM